MKKGSGSGFQNAFGYLQEAAGRGLTTEVVLGWAHYQRTRPDVDLDAAKKFYLRAAAGGRFRGFFGYSEVARELGQHGRAWGADCIRITLGPLMALLLGKRTQGRF
jgi:hypothetical protein